MTIKVKDSGTVRTITGMKIKFGGVVRTIRRVKAMESSTVRTVAEFVQPLTVSAVPSVVAVTGAPSDDLTTPTTTATPTGGTAPYTYAWTKLSGTTATIISPTSASTKFFKGGVGTGVFSAVFQVLCTDASGNTATANCTATFRGIPDPGS